MRIEGWKGWGWTCLSAVLVAQGPSEEGDRARSLQQLRELMTLPVLVATGTPTPWQQTPASVTVITGADLEAMGADTLDEALAMVPGLHVSQSGQLMGSRFLFRGIASLFNPQVLILRDGVPLTSVAIGDRGAVGTRIPVISIARVEVIRGPGSAVYGEEAFAGVIHIHTRAAEDLEGTKVAGLGGSYGTRSAWVSHGGAMGPVQVGLTASLTRTDGPGGVLQADAQTGWDGVGATFPVPAPAVSRAPGALNRMGKFGDLHLNLGWGAWVFRWGQESRTDMGTGQGLALALDPEGRQASHRSLMSLTYRRPEGAGPWTYEVQASWYRLTYEVEQGLHLFPAGAFFGAFPEGFQGNPQFWEVNRRIEGSATYRGSGVHRFRIGGGLHHGELTDVRETKNFNAAFAPLPGGLTDVSGTPLDYLPRASRMNQHGFIQDEWQVHPAWQLTTGLRFDRYSDFGSSTNPRLALVGDLGGGWTVKVLHGQAFRAPSLTELYTRNNPVSLGNPTLRPETLATQEVALGWQMSPDLHWEVSLFRTHIRDFINFKQDPIGTRTAQNADRLKGQGGELSLIYAPSQRFRITANASYQDTRDEATDRPLGEAPRARAYLRVDRRFLTYWQGDFQATWVGTRPRSASDPRPDLRGYTTVDAVLRRERLFGWLDLRVSVRNLLDRDVREPSQAPAPGAAFVDIPHDLPQAGRNVMVELVWRGR